MRVPYGMGWFLLLAACSSFAEVDRGVFEQMPCQLSRPNTQAGRIKDIPAWSFHGAKDPTVPVAADREMAAALKKPGAGFLNIRSSRKAGM